MKSRRNRNLRDVPRLAKCGFFVGLSLLVVSCSETRSFAGAERNAYEAWCNYVIERDSLTRTATDCALELWNEGTDVPASPELLRQYIILEEGVFRYCDQHTAEYSSIDTCRVEAPLILYADLVGETSSEMLLQSLGFAVGMESLDLPMKGRTWLINGQLFNDPWGMDYKNDPDDVYGDGR